MLCPSCTHGNTRVLRKDGLRRRRECLDCGRRWSTEEWPVADLKEAKRLRRELDAAVRAETALRRQLLELSSLAKRAAS